MKSEIAEEGPENAEKSLATVLPLRSLRLSPRFQRLKAFGVLPP
jgi:hypothetical protein